jgi:deoxyribodipyrimidine photo-lyase
MDSSPSILWFRQDLRLDDNPALAAAARSGAIIPIYIFSPTEEGNWPSGMASRWWLSRSLRSLDKQLQQLGSRLVVRQGSSEKEICEIASATGVRRVFCNRRYEPAAVYQDQRLAAALAKLGIELRHFNGSLLFEPAEILNQEGAPYRVFTSFRNRSLQIPVSAVPDSPPARLSSPSMWPTTVPLELVFPPANETLGGRLDSAWTPGEDSAIRQVENFLESPLRNYITDREQPDLDGTSRLSPFLHFGEISPRRIWQRVCEWVQQSSEPGGASAAEAFLRQLIWREFAYYILHHFPQTPERPSHPEFAKFPWRKDERALLAWQEGRTGYPLVDAGMRQLIATGWMHNRVRMIVASFLTKHLLIRWQSGAQWFWEKLVDADLANNIFGWQWAAGCGHDAAPYFRIFNPVLQGQKFDVQGNYIRRWVPELTKVPARWIHQPWSAPSEALAECSVKLGRDYPLPIVEHTNARARALSALAYIREGKSSRSLISSP